MVIETRAGVPAGVLDEGLQRLQTQIHEHSGAIEELHAKFDRLESKVDSGLDNLQAMMRELLLKQPGVEQPAVQPVVEQPAVQPRQGEHTPNRMRNAMPMRPLNQDFRAQANQPRVGMQMGEFFENGRNGPILGEFGDPIEERGNGRNNARFMPPFQGHLDAPYEEPWLGRRQGRQQGQQAQLEPILGDFGDPIEERRNVGNNVRFMPPFQGHFDAPYEEPWLGRQQGQQGQQAQFEPHAAPPRHGMHFGDPRGGPMGERPRQYQGAHHRDPYWQEQDGPPWNQGRARDPRPMKLDFPRFKGGDPTAWVYRALQYFHYYQVLEPEKVGCKNARAKELRGGLCLGQDTRGVLGNCEEEVQDQPMSQAEAHGSSHKPNKGQLRVENKNTSPSTMRVIAIVNGQKTVVLLDTGSTHNFMDGTLAKTLKLPIDVGKQLWSEGSKWPKLGGYGIVLGTQWLSTLGMINWDFKNLMMGFMHEGNKVWLQGLKEKPNLIQGSKDFKGKATMKGLLFQIMPCELASIQEEIGAPIRELVEEFPQGFSNLLAYLLGHGISISMDFVEGLSTSSKQNVILVSVDRFTKYVHFIPLSHPYTVSRVAFLFLQHMFKLHGLSSSIVSERDTAFTSLFWEELFRRQGVDLTMSSSYHPQFDEPTEVVNKSLEHYLRAIIADKPSLWVEWLPLAEYWFNSNYHTSTKLSPFEALYGYLPARLIEFVPGLTRVAAVEDLLEHRQQVVGLLEHNLVAAQARMKQQVDKHRAEMEFEFGDWVIQRVGMVAYKLELPEGACIHPVFHVSFLKAKLGKTITPISRLPPTDALGHLAPQPAKILETRTIKKRRIFAVTKVLVQGE
uniref:Integrase catalytic domain-containing protein n=1 Tax=Fagus sylvatica TaxID=28930 RepID=A0A2N9EEA7_FAGSY